MRTKKHLMIAGTALTFAAAILLAVWRTVFMKEYYNPYTLEYDLEADPVIKTFGWTLFAVVLLISALAFSVRKANAGNVFMSSCQFSVFASAFCGVAFICAPILAIVAFPTVVFDFGNDSYAFYHFVLPISTLLMFICGTYFLINASVKLGGHPAKKFTALLLPVWGILFLCASYFDSDYIYTDTNRILANMAAVSSMLLLLLEARSAIGRKTNALSFLLSLTTILFAFVYFIPTMCLTAFWEMKPTVINYLELFQLGMIFHASSVAAEYINGTSKNAASIAA